MKIILSFNSWELSWAIGDVQMLIQIQLNVILKQK